MIKFKSFSSGSCGNCYFLGLEEDGKISASIIIDAGVSTRRLKKEMEADHLDTASLNAALVTHDHMDHIRSLGSFCKHLKKPVYATTVLHNAMARHTYTLEHIGAVRRDLKEGEWNEIVPGKIYAKYFVVPHDATQTVGYGIKIGDHRFVIMTDVGAMTAEALSFASHADTLVIESNYDLEMLLNGSYTPDLKRRIRSGNGHLSNAECAAALKQVVHPELNRVFLCHLSENNNEPRLAFDCSSQALKEVGADHVRLVVLPRRNPSPIFTL